MLPESNAELRRAAQRGTASFPAGSTGPYWVNIAILDDGIDEPVGSETFYVQLSGSQNAQIGGDNPFTVFIEEEQQKPTDTLWRNPCPNSDLLASKPLHWYYVTRGFQSQKGAPGPGPGTPV